VMSRMRCKYFVTQWAIIFAMVLWGGTFVRATGVICNRPLERGFFTENEDRFSNQKRLAFYHSFETLWAKAAQHNPKEAGRKDHNPPTVLDLQRHERHHRQAFSGLKVDPLEVPKNNPDFVSEKYKISSELILAQRHS